MDYEKKIDIPFGAKDSELKGWEYTIPEGMEAIIKDGKVIVREKASEDEEIRKWLIDYFNDYYDRSGDTFCGMQITRILAYLEKQKEQKPAEWSDTDKKGLDNCCAIIAMPDIFFDKIIRQKCLDFLYELPERFNLQPKPEWSEEDTEMYINVASSLRGYACGLENEEHKRHIKKELDWLENRFKSLRPQPQGIYQQVVKGLRDMCDRYEQNGLFTDGRARDFLGNVRVKCKDAIECAPILDEPSWKPSKEQIEAVRYFVNKHQSEAWAATGQWKQFTALRGLLGELQKLM